MKLVWTALIIAIVSGIYLAKPEISPGKEIKIDSGNSENTEVNTQEISVSTFPEKPVQGEPVLVTINTNISNIEAVTFNGNVVKPFVHKNTTSVLIGIDLRMKTGMYQIEVVLKSGEIIKHDLFVGERSIVKKTFGIPEKLGGNTSSSEKNLTSTLAQEGALINSIGSVDEKLWDGNFRSPLGGEVVVTDIYGYSRLTGASTIAHKGTDFRAPIGTNVYAMNSGVVAYTGFLRNYGHVIVLDHGLGLQTIYMHLSQILVKKGDSVNSGSLLAKSGDTGYVLGPHLHLSVKIDHISIDPMKFIEILGK